MSKPVLRKAWRQYYRVWLQAEGRDRNDHEYAAQCVTCVGAQQGTDARGKSSPWLVSMAGSREEAWEVCKKHEQEKHDLRAEGA